MKAALWIGLAALVTCSAWADAIPKPSANDPRIGIVEYTPHDVYTINVAKGVLTRIVLGNGEQILESGTGFVANCETGVEWCIKAEKGQNQIWVKPYSAATSNNLELFTTRGDYSFRFVVVKGAEAAKDVFYRVIFRHPVVLPAAQLSVAEPPKDAIPSDPSGTPTVSVPAEPKKPDYLTPAVRNYDYSRKSLPAARDLAPSVVFDDGRFTYMRFEKAQEVPTVFAVGADDIETRVATHSERLAGDPQQPDAKVEHDYLVVQRTARKFVLRLGALVIEIINNKFDPKGIETFNGTTTDKLIRGDKQ